MASMRNNSKTSVFETYIEDDNRQKQVSEVLKKYDLDGDGKLDAAEQQNIGHDMLRMEDIARLQKKLLMFAFGVIVFLCVSNIATGYLAVMLAKDTKVAKDGVMKDNAGGNVKTQAIAPKVNLYESLETGTRRKLQNEDNPDGVVLQGFVDSEGIVAIVEGGVARFITQSGMQACDITKVTRTSVTLFLLETTCGIGTLELLNTDADGRRLNTPISFEINVDYEDADAAAANTNNIGSLIISATVDPTANPSATPSSIPTTQQPVTPHDEFFSPTNSPVTSLCKDSSDPFPEQFGDIAGLYCLHVALLPSIQKGEYCEIVAEHCPRTCGSCPCQDDPLFSFPNSDGSAFIKCVDIPQMEKQQYCSPPEDVVAEHCRRTCGLCPDQEE